MARTSFVFIVVCIIFVGVVVATYIKFASKFVEIHKMQATADAISRKFDSSSLV